MAQRELKCAGCGIDLGHIEGGRIRKNIVHLCNVCESKRLRMIEEIAKLKQQLKVIKNSEELRKMADKYKSPFANIFDNDFFKS